MSGAFDTSSADHPKQLQQKHHLFSQQQHCTNNNNKSKTVRQFVVGGCEPTESKSTRAGPINRPSTPGPVTIDSDKDGSEGESFSKQFFSKPSSLVNLEVHRYYPHSPFPAHSSAYLVQHLANETVKINNNWDDKRTKTTTVAVYDNTNGVVNSSNGPLVPADNNDTNHRSKFYPSDKNDRPFIIPSRSSRDQRVNAVTNLPSTLSLATPLTNNCIKEEVVEPNKRSEQLPQGGEFAVPAVPARLKAAASVSVEPPKEEGRREQLFLGGEEEEIKASTSAISEIEGGRIAKEESKEESDGRCDEELTSGTSTAAEVASVKGYHRLSSTKPSRLAFRISAAAALKLRRIARTHARALRRLGINAVLLDQQQLAGNSSCCTFPLHSSLSEVRILSRTPSPEVAQRKTRQQLLLQQKQRLHQLAQQQLVVVAQQFRGQSSTEICSPNKVAPLHLVRSAARLPPPSTAAIPTPAYPFHHPPVIHQSMDRPPQHQQSGPSTVPITPVNSVIAENSPHLVNLLSSNVPPNPPHQQNTAPQQLVTQQRFVGNAPLQQTSNQAALTPQQQQYQQHLYQQQIHQQRIQQVQQQQQNAMLFGTGGAPSIAGQMHPNQTALMVAGHQLPHPSFMLHPQLTHQPVRPHGIPSGGVPPPHGVVPMGAAGGMPPPYAMLPQQQQPITTVSAAKANTHGTEVEEPPKKRKRISKKQQQKEEKEREQQQQQQLRMQQEVAMVQMQRQQQQQMYLHQRQMAMQQQGMAPMPSQGLIGTSQQNYQQQMYHQQQQYVAQQQSNQPNVFNSPPHGGSAVGGHYTNQQNTPPQPSPQQYPMGAQPAMHYMSSPGIWGASPQQQNITDYQQQSQMAVAGPNPSHSLPTVVHMPSQQQQQHFRTPGTPSSVSGAAMCYGHSPATTTCSTSTPFHSPPPQQQMVGTPSAGHHTPMGGGPTPPYGNGHCSAGSGSVLQQHQSQRATPVGSGESTIEHSRTNTPQQPQQQQPFGLHSMQQHNAQSYQQGLPSHQSLQQISPADFYQQQKSAQTKQQIFQQSPNNQQYHQSTSVSVFPQLSDFAEGGLVDDLVVPTIYNEADDFDLDSIEPMRCGDNQQGYHNQQQQPHEHVQAEQQQQALNQHAGASQQHNVFTQQEQLQLMLQRQNIQSQHSGATPSAATSVDSPQHIYHQGIQQHMAVTANHLRDQRYHIPVQQQMLNQQQQQQQMALCQQQRRSFSADQQYQSPPMTVPQQIEEANHIEMSAEEKIAAEMEMLPDRSPQLDKPLSPSKLSEAQDRNVTDAIATVMERVAKGAMFVGNAGGKTSKSKSLTSKRGSLSCGNSSGPSNQQQQPANSHTTVTTTGITFFPSSVSRTPTPKTPSSSGGVPAVASTSTLSIGASENCGEKMVTKGRKQQFFGDGGSSYPPSLQQPPQQQQRSADVLLTASRPFSYPPSGTALAENSNGRTIAHAQQLTRNSCGTSSGTNSPFQIPIVQQAVADSSTSASTTPTTASSVGGGGGPFSHFNGFHAPMAMHTSASNSSISPPAERKTPLSAPKTIESSMRFEMDSCHQLVNVKQAQTSQRKRKGDKRNDSGEKQQQALKRKPSKDSKSICGPSLTVASAENNSLIAPASTTTVSTRTP